MSSFMLWCWAKLLLPLAVLVGSVWAPGKAGDAPSTTLHVRVGGAVFTLTGAYREQVLPNPLEGHPYLTFTIPADKLGISFPPVTFGKRRREEIYVVIRSAQRWTTLRESYRRVLSGLSGRRSGGFDVYRLDPITDLYLGRPPVRPDAIECRGIGAEPYFEICQVREYLYRPQNGIKATGVIIDYGMTYGEFSLFPILDERVRELLKTVSTLSEPPLAASP